jgi:serine/threonine protein kinase
VGNKGLERILIGNNLFLKPEDGLQTELFVFEQHGIPDTAQRDIKREYTPEKKVKLMKKMYNLSPENIVKPMGLVNTERGKIHAFELVHGDNITMYAYKLRKNRELAYNVIDQLKSTVKKLHDNGYVHGDLVGGNNIMLTHDNKVKLIDPLYIPKDFKYKQLFVDLDNEEVDKLSGYLLGEKVKHGGKYE